MQIIQSLGKRLADFEEELSWGAPAAELRHLTGRIGELYAAMITNGQMALETNQAGYDVISAENERISVKTCTTHRPNPRLNKATLDKVDRVIILKLHHGEDGVSIEEILDAPKDQALQYFRETKDAYVYSGKSQKVPLDLSRLRVIEEAHFQGNSIRRYENGSYQVVSNDGEVAGVTKDKLREIAKAVGISPHGNPNTRQWGKLVLDYLKKLN
ncbi:MAG: hypothetical protein AAF198_13050 [Pseudomonadota bacterium]